MTEDRGWRWVAASVRGTGHATSDLPCQDAWQGRSIGTETVLLVAADGAGSAAHAEVGSRLVCDFVLDLLAETLALGGIGGLGHDDAVACVRGVVTVLQGRAEADGADLRDYACTLLVAVAGPEGGLFFQIGDGVIVIRDAQSCRPVFWPQSGEYANTTYFVTDASALDRLQFHVVSAPIWDVAVLTDGLQMLALRFSERAAHEPFFDPMFDRLRNEPSGKAEELCRHLEAFLDSESVNARTDDDKTLLLATRPLPARGVSGVDDQAL